MSQHAKQSKENGGRIPYQPYSITSKQQNKFGKDDIRPRYKNVLTLKDENQVPIYIKAPNGQIINQQKRNN